MTSSRRRRTRTKTKTNDKGKTNSKKKNYVKNWYPDFDHYSPQQLSQLIHSLERTLSTLQERLRIVESQKQQNKNLVHQSLTPSYLNQIQHLNPSNFSPYMYNHGDAATLSQLPLSASLSNQLQLPESLDAAWFWSEHVFGQHHQQQQLSTSWRVKHTRILTVSFGTSICSE